MVAVHLTKHHRHGPEAARKVVLAFSGGLDSTVLISVLRENYGYEVIAVHVDVGEVITTQKEVEQLRRLALQAGACEFHIIDARERFAQGFVLPALKANALYQNRYPLSSAISRPLIIEAILEVGRRRGAVAFAHGASGKGNDHVRFDLAARGLDPNVRMIAPQRDRYMSRNAAVDYAVERRIPVPERARGAYSIDTNIWGRSIQGGELEYIDRAPPEDVWTTTVNPRNAPDSPRDLVIRFENGCPVALDGEVLGLVALIDKANQIGAQHGVGRIDVLEDRLTGIKSRELYEAPGALVLIEAHRDLEATVIDRNLRSFKNTVDSNFARLAYDGFWHSPLREALEAFIESVQRFVIGEVTVRLFKGHATVVGRSSPNALYDKGLATYGIGDRFNHRAAEGWTHLEAIPLGMFRAMHPTPHCEPLSELEFELPFPTET